jgi:hypothetical protein
MELQPNILVHISISLHALVTVQKHRFTKYVRTKQTFLSMLVGR